MSLVFFFSVADSALCHVTASTSCCSHKISLCSKLLPQYCWRGHDGGKSARFKPNHLSHCAGVFLPPGLSCPDARISPGPSHFVVIGGRENIVFSFVCDTKLNILSCMTYYSVQFTVVFWGVHINIHWLDKTNYMDVNDDRIFIYCFGWVSCLKVAVLFFLHLILLFI